MKKKYLICFLGIMALTAAAALYGKPGFLFEQDGSRSWNLIRSLVLGGTVGYVLTFLLALYREREKLRPYVRKLKKYRYLLYQLVRRDFTAKYKRSVLGVLWSVLNPLAIMLVMTVVFSTLFRFEIENYPVYLLSGQIVFTLFSESTNMCMNSILGSGSLIKKVSVPKYIFPISKALSSLVNFAFSLVAFFLVVLVTGTPLHWSMLAMLIPAFYVFVFSLGVGLLLAAMMVFFRDISYLYGIFLTALNYLTPLFYPVSIIPDRLRWLISLNPMYHFVECFRTVAIYGGMPTPWQHIVCIMLALFTLSAGLAVFYKKQDQFILYI